jgi:thiamine biosynthesis lipoprotein
MKWLNYLTAAGLMITGMSAKLPVPVSLNKTTHLFISHFENVLGTSLELKIVTSSQKKASLAEAAALEEISRLDKILSAYDPASEFSSWLKTSRQAVHVSPELFEVLNLFDQWRSRSGGALDASAEVITKVWKQAAAKKRMPTQIELTEALAEVKQLHWKLDPAMQTATHLSHAPLMLNSFAKSYIIRRAADAAMGATNVISIVVNIGGDLVVSGDLRETIQISDPKADAENDAPIDLLQIGNKAVATSGNYRRGEFIEGHWYSHIVDPRTGQPADEVISATVVAPLATDAGALATIFNVLSPAESVQLAAGIPGVDYLIITRSGEQITSKGWRSLEAPGARQAHGLANSGDKITMNPSLGTDFELVVNLEINLQQGGFAKRPYVAVWVEDENHAAVRTIAVWHERDKYLPELKSWYLKYRGMYNTDKSPLNSVSSATRSPGKYTLKWDGKDDQGNFVKPGTYTIKIEASREHGTYQLMRQELVWNDTPKQISLPGNVEIASASLEYRKKTSTN